MANYQSIHTGSNIDYVISNALLQTDAANTYLTQINASNTYLTIINADTLYPLKDGTGASGTWAISAATALKLEGFASSGITNTGWGNQTGTTVCWSNDPSGGSYDFRRDNPMSGQLSLKVDGRFYCNEGNYVCTWATNETQIGGPASPVYVNSSGQLIECNKHPGNKRPSAACIATISGDGVMEVGRYMDWHFSTDTTQDYSFRIENPSAGQLNFSGNLYLNGAILPRSSIGGSTFAEALKSYFNSYKSTTTRNALLNFHSSAYGNGSQLFGYFLSGYDSNPYGGFYICHYASAKYVGISNGTYTQYEITKSASSSAFTKENIAPMTDEEALKILNLNLISFDYKPEYENGAKGQFGLMAEECKEIIPWAVVSPPYNPEEGEEKPVETIEYWKFIPYLLKMVQIQQDEINELKKEIQQLKEMINSG